MLKSITKSCLDYANQFYVTRRLNKKNKSKVDFKLAKRILCLQMNAIGDTLMTQPALSAIKCSIPHSTIDLICRPHIAPLFIEDPGINAVYSFEHHRIISWIFKDINRLKKLLIEKSYDLIIDFSALPLTAALCASQLLSPSIGFSRKVVSSMGNIDLGNAYDWTMPYSENENLRYLMRTLVSPLTGSYSLQSFPTLELSERTESIANEILKGKKLKKKGYIIIHPGAKWIPKKWPLDNCRKLMELVQKKLKVPIILLGSIDDKDYITQIAKGFDIDIVIPLISDDLLVSSSIIKNSLLCINNDSAAMHIAAAVGTSSISIFGPVDPSRSCPTKEEGCTVLYDSTFCSPCPLYYSSNRCRRGINFCMYQIEPQSVFHEIKNIINSTITNL